MSSVLPVIIDPEISENPENEEKSLNVEINDEEVFSDNEEEEQVDFEDILEFEEEEEEQENPFNPTQPELIEDEPSDNEYDYSSD